MFRKFCALTLIVILLTGCAEAYDLRGEDAALRAHIAAVCAEYAVPELLVHAVIERESSWNADAVNAAGNCHGLMQINEVNFSWLERELGLDDPTDPYQNVTAGVYMLSQYLTKYLDYHMALMCYNCGEGGARRRWRAGEYSTTYSEWVVDRMEELEWEALEAAREETLVFYAEDVVRDGVLG